MLKRINPIISAVILCVVLVSLPMPVFALVGEVKLPVPFFRQEQQFSCEAAAIHMVLQYFGFKLSESEILEKMPKDTTPRSAGIWGDPDKGFVGNIFGKSGQESYGIHWRPVAAFVSQWVKPEVIEHGTLNDLVKRLKKGQPVIVWVYHGSGKKMVWKTPHGKTVNAIEDEHTVVVNGFEGPQEKPTGLFILDPAEAPRLVPTAEFMNLWNSFDHAGLAVDRKIKSRSVSRRRGRPVSLSRNR